MSDYLKNNMNSEPEAQSRFQPRLLLTGAIIMVCTAVVWTHWPALSAQAMSFDDDQYLTQNLLVQTPGWPSAKRFLTEIFEPSTVGGYYQPLTMISLMADYASGGRPDNLMPFHRTSLVLHAANTALIIILLYLLFGRVWIAAGIGLLFGVHPMTVEPITWVGDRKTLLAALFALWCLILHVCYVKKNGRLYYLGSLLMYLFAVMSKPTAIPVPALMLLIDIWPLGRRGKRIFTEKIPFFATMFVFAIITYISQGRTAGVELAGGYGPAKILSVLCYSITFYFHKIIWPVNLTSQYPPARLELTNPVIAASVIGVIISIVILITSLRWTRALFVGCFFFLVGLLPTIQIFRFSYVFTSDKYAYLPVVGLLMLLALLLKRLSAKPIVRTVAVIIVLLLATAEAGATRRYLVYWRDTTSLCERMLSLAPDAAAIHDMLGRALAGEGRIEEAMEHYRRALELEPDDALTYSNLGIALAAQGKMDEAIGCFERSIQIYPAFAEAYNNLGLAFAAQKKYERAVESYQKAIRAKPVLFHAYNNLGLAMKSQGKFDEAVDCFRQALAIKKDYAAAYYNLANTLWVTGKADEAIEYFRQAVESSPNDPVVLNGLADALTRHPDTKKRNVSQAINLAERAVRLTGYQDPEMLETLAAAYAADGRFAIAASTAQKGLELASAAHAEELVQRLQKKMSFYKSAP